MLVWFLHAAQFHWSWLRVFQYITFRSIVGALTAFIITVYCCPKFIRTVTALQFGQVVREDGPQTHLKKIGTPTMGGALMLGAITLSLVLWGDLTNRYVLVAIFVMLSFGWIGWVDDYRKVVRKNTTGLPARWKYFWQSVVALMVAIYLYALATPGETELVIPFVKSVLPQLGFFYVILAYFVIVGSSNAANLTDGLDGLVSMPVVLIAVALGVFAYVSGNVIFSQYLSVPFVAGTGELVVICASVFGAGLGFLWFNAYPAQLFMGDVGSLGLGALLGVMAVMVRQELVFFVMSGVFVIETLSVILQVSSFKLRGKRVFKMAPIHHHFELKGWAEPKVIVRFWIATVIFVLIGLATLKLR